MDYEWDTAKAAENRRRHGIDFTDSIAALEDPNRLEEIDARAEYGEERIRVIIFGSRPCPVRHHDPARRENVSHHLRPEGDSL